MTTLYEDEDFLVTCSDTTFDAFVIFCNSAAGLDRVGVNRVEKAKDIAGKPICNIYTPYGINEINFWSKTAHWYQRKSAEHCVNIIHSLIRGHEKQTVIYGSSMGGFGAIHFGSELGVTSVAFSPQVTLAEEFNIAKDWYLPLEYAQKQHTGFKSNIIDGKCTDHNMFVFYDDTCRFDIKHAEWLMKHCTNCHLYPVAAAGHGMGVVNKIYPFKRIILDVLNGTFDKDIFYHEIDSKFGNIIPPIVKEYGIFHLPLWKIIKYRGEKRFFLLNQLIYSKKYTHGKNIKKLFNTFTI